MESVTCLSSCSVVLRYLVSGAGAIHGEFPLRPKMCLFIVYRRQYGKAICAREGFASTKTPIKMANIAVGREKTRIVCGDKTLRGSSRIHRVVSY